MRTVLGRGTESTAWPDGIPSARLAERFASARQRWYRTTMSTSTAYIPSRSASCTASSSVGARSAALSRPAMSGTTPSYCASTAARSAASIVAFSAPRAMSIVPLARARAAARAVLSGVAFGPRAEASGPTGGARSRRSGRTASQRTSASCPSSRDETFARALVA